ncbi:uncharacterized protein LOC110614583 [Manihot esculenta]|uniref:Uncharacterized protein n=1 Tax=Manihot esculenta TaxID=3983 RepID=A0A2C9VRZ0_MANES|nr:uncharacterized protein LOC110614583 [Manihot esculenta]OAY48747.1 hypothetical protein MANES_05G002600v8 [Manihot esculenta]
MHALSSLLVMGNYLTNPSSKATGRVILSDGRVHEFEKPLTVAELMLEYPQQVVVEFRPDLSEKRPIPLPADNKLDMKKVYVMLPMKRGKPASLSSEQARHVVSVLGSRSLLSSSRFLPLFARICPAGGIEEGQTTTKFVSERKENDSELMLAEMLENRPPEYLSRQLSGKGWKPSLDTIKEKKVEKKIPHWLFNFQA